MNYDTNILEVLDYIDPALLDYQEWVSVGMALKDAGHTAADWDSWSQRDTGRYHSGECWKKWQSFNGSNNPVTEATIVQLAKDQGWSPYLSAENYRELDWDSEIQDRDELRIIDENWVEGKEVVEPEEWQPHLELIKYLSILFNSDENVGYVTDCWQKDDKYLPTKGLWDRTAGQLIEELQKCGGDLGAVIGDCKPEVGAWIRFNPLDGKGIRNENVAAFRYALVESDDMEIDKQHAIIRELELPAACLVHSGKKSLHAIVRIDADTYDDYRKRVDYLYDVCRKNGLKIDTQNRNPSRLSRMPGVMRNGHKQFLVDTNIGKGSWAEWQEWIEDINDDLPEPENLTAVWDNLPELSPSLIEGVLRQGHKMLLAGPSKAGKSYALIELCCAIAEGKRWLNWDCAKGKIMYVNLELDRASCLHRFKDVYAALEWDPNNLANIDIWNLRGNSVPMDKLAPKLIRRAAKKNYIAIIIDPIYKVITGDENSADQMAHFCNQFDKVCHELGAAVIYCHHHSKGQQGNKRSMDRASGSGVFARDPDALLDLIELELPDDMMKQEENKAVCRVCNKWLEKQVPDYDSKVSQDDLCSEKAMLGACDRLMGPDTYRDLLPEIYAARQAVRGRTAWRIEGTLREFPKFRPVNLWFDYPIHTVDTVGSLDDVEAEGEAPPWKKATEKRKESAKNERESKKEEFENAVNNCNFGDPPTVEMLCESLDLAKRTIESRMHSYGYEVVKGKVYKKGTAIDVSPQP